MSRHRWDEGIVITPNKTERECLNRCGIIMVSRHEFEGGRELHCTECWRGLDRIEGKGTPVCERIGADA
jgi:hypothetical protein